MKISVIIPALNSRKDLEHALESIWNQEYRDFEVIVMDGGSKDGTEELLRKNQHRLAYWESNPDKGTTDALNRGFAKATGELITFLCADDEFMDSKVFGDIVAYFKRAPATEVLCCHLEAFDPDDSSRRIIGKSNPDRLASGMTVHMPGAFIRKGVLNGRVFNDDVEVANDYELFSYLLKEKKAKFEVYERITVRFSLGGRTNQPETDFKLAQERFYVRRRYFNPASAYVLLVKDLTVTALRRLNIRPYTWMRMLRRRFIVA
jgi:glycosyltransferase involved in cell wall biosynthesis